MTSSLTMSTHGHTIVVGVLLFCFSVPAQPAVPAGSGGEKVSGKTTPVPPQPTPPRSPVDLFRSVLSMTPVERREFLAQRSPESQKLILAKIHEYEGLTPELRDLRLRVTELRWYLRPLLELSPADRIPHLNFIPPALKELVEARLSEWDKLTPEVQKEFLENESIIRFYFELAARTPGQRAEAVTSASPPAVPPGLTRWQNLTTYQRQEIMRHFYQYFDLSPSEKRKTIQTLSETERVQIESTLQAFDSLSASQRAQCVRSFQKFASFDPDERRQFLHNAERWERMSPSDRQAWRNLVSSLSQQPPLPPGLSPPPIPSSPAPSRSAGATNSSSWATNTN
jgi:hypothetical protein